MGLIYSFLPNFKAKPPLFKRYQELFDQVPKLSKVCYADDPELDAQVPAAVPPGARQRHPQAALLHLQDVRLQGDRVHRRHGIPEREGEKAFVVRTIREPLLGVLQTTRCS